ncbi:tetratricopeptide repeat protein [Symmachiella dynata]|uniref:O-linked N-acetylglucosamine transferase family protein n=1 Tax=Symmachiella dynata TaxID=2527995 RepID=UPI0030EC0B32
MNTRTPTTFMNENRDLFNVAFENHQAGRLGEAESLYRDVLRVDPAHTDALHLLGVVAHQSGRHQLAVEMIQRAIAINGNNHLYHSNLGASQLAMGRLGDAIASCRRAVELAPKYAAAQFNLARAYQAAGETAAAEAGYRRTLQVDPRHAESRLNLGNLLFDRGEIQAAIEEFRASVQCNPNFAYAHYNLGNALLEIGQTDEAIACLQTTIQLKPDYAEGYNNLGNAYRSRDQLDEALTFFTTACRLNPQHAIAHNNRGSVLQSQGCLAEAFSAYTRSQQIMPADAATHSNALVAANYLAEQSPQELFQRHRDWAEQHAVDCPRRQFRNVADPERRLRIGYSSPDFRTHPVASFFLPLLQQHDRTVVEVTCYSNTPRPDRMTAQLEAGADRWRDVRRWSDEQMVQAVLADEIDILVDLAGHTAHNRLQVFAQKPAPVQVSFLGYPNTTGLPTIDYRITDGIADPAGEARTHSETLIRLPGPFCCYAPPNIDVEVRSLPADRKGYVTFGSLHNLAKLNPQVVETWSAVLRSVPQSRLLIARSTLSRSSAERLSAEFVKNGIATGRIDFRQLSKAEGGYLRVYDEIDVILDAFPWSGHTTTCEAFWMGVPVLTLRGNRHAGRMGASLLTHMGLHEWIAESRADYVSQAATLATDVAALRSLRISLRDRLLMSPICDARRYAANMEEAYRRMWRQWCPVETSFVIDTCEQILR